MTNKEIMEIALRQSAVDSNCSPDDFLKDINVLVDSGINENARRYLKLPFACDLVSYGSNIVASVRPDLRRLVNEYISHYQVEHCFETPNLHVLNDGLEKYGLRVCFMAEYFLPDIKRLKRLPCSYEMRVLAQEDFKQLYCPEWGNALCENRKELDVLGMGAYDGDKLVGLAGSSADCGTMWQIGVDVLPGYRRQGIASALTAGLALEILARGKVPFYCAAWCNLKSVRNAIRSGFVPSWVEITAKSIGFVDELNGTWKIN